MSRSQHKVYLVRHGEAAASWGESADPGLSALGIQQAIDASVDLRERLNGRDGHLLSSPLLRAQETARPLADALDRPVHVDERFREIPSTVPLAERQKWLTTFMRGQWNDQDAYLHTWRSGIFEALDGLPHNSVVFSHFLVINAVVGVIEERDETLVCWPDNGSITTVSTINGRRQALRGKQMKTHVN